MISTYESDLQLKKGTIILKIFSGIDLVKSTKLLLKLSNVVVLFVNPKERLKSISNFSILIFYRQ